MSAEIIPFPTRGQPRGQPRGHPVQRGAAEAAEIEPGGNVALFVLTETGAATAWVSEEVQTTEHWDYVLDFLRQVETALLQLRAERGG